MFKIKIISIEYIVEIDMKLIVVDIYCIKNLKIFLVFCENYFFNYDHYAYISHKRLKG